MSSLSDKYVKEVVPKLKEEFGLKNNLSLPRIEKIVLNTGAAEALSDKGAIEKISEQMAAIAG